MRKQIGREYLIIQNKLTFIPKLKIFDKNNNLIGILKINWLTSLKGTIKIKDAKELAEDLFIINTKDLFTNKNFLIKLDKKNELEIKRVNINKKIYKKKYLNSYINTYKRMYSRHIFEIKLNKSTLFMAYERGNVLYKYKDLLFFIPIFGDIFDHMLNFITKTKYEIIFYDIAQNQKNVVANIIISNNFFRKIGYLSVSDKDNKNDKIYYSFLTLLIK